MDDALDKYIEYYESLTRRSIRLIEKIADPQMRFRDPFNDVSGLTAFEEIMSKMFEDVENPSFKVIDKSWGQDGMTAYIKWHFTCGSSSDPRLITGMSEVVFAPYNALVVSHKDYWDAAENVYEKIPVLGGIIRLIKSRIAI